MTPREESRPTATGSRVDRLAHSASAARLGRPRLHLRVIGSTNDRARELALAGAPHGTLVTADAQTAGRGRQGRRWSAPAGSSLLMSLVLRPAAQQVGDEPHGARTGENPRGGRDENSQTPVSLDRRFAMLPLAAAVAVCDVAGPESLVKWPNDIVFSQPPRLAKLAGILVEGRPQQGWAVLGIGVNVALRLEDLPAELRPAAATLGRAPAEIEPLLAALLAALEHRLGDEPARTLDAWRARDALRGREIAWSDGRGTAAGVDDAGRLLVMLPRGSHTALAAGEVHLREIA